MRVVFDTNVLFAALTANGLCHDLLEEASATLTLVWSPALRNELVSALRKKHLATESALAAIEALVALCDMHPPTPLAKRVCRDRDDDTVLGVALAGRSDAIVTGDDDLLVLRRYERCRILSSRQLFELLHAKKRGL